MIRAAAAILIGVLWLAGSGCTGQPMQFEPQVSSPVALRRGDIPQGLTIGVVVSSTSPAGEGSDWYRGAHGARVAGYRYLLGGSTVRIEVADDSGKSSAAIEAVQDLVERGATALIFATSGDHLTAAVEAAAKLGLPTILPYQNLAEPPKGVWLTGAPQTGVDQAIKAALQQAHVSAPLVLLAGDGEVPAGYRERPVLEFEGKLDESGRQVAEKLNSERADSLIVVGSAAQQADLVRQLQAEQITVPVVLTSAATSPTFADTLAKVGGSLNTALVSVGLDHSDHLALQTGSLAESRSTFLAAVRAAAGDETIQTYFEGRPFLEVSAAADPSSHDALIALVTAAAKAGSSEPAAIAGVLEKLSLGPAEGLAGTSLDFHQQQAAAADAVAVLAATTSDAGLRPGDPVPLSWFTVTG